MLAYLHVKFHADTSKLLKNEPPSSIYLLEGGFFDNHEAT